MTEYENEATPMPFNSKNVSFASGIVSPEPEENLYDSVRVNSGLETPEAFFSSHAPKIETRNSISSKKI